MVTWAWNAVSLHWANRREKMGSTSKTKCMTNRENWTLGVLPSLEQKIGLGSRLTSAYLSICVLFLTEWQDWITTIMSATEKFQGCVIMLRQKSDRCYMCWVFYGVFNSVMRLVTIGISNMSCVTFWKLWSSCVHVLELVEYVRFTGMFSWRGLECWAYRWLLSIANPWCEIELCQQRQQL